MNTTRLLPVFAVLAAGCAAAPTNADIGEDYEEPPVEVAESEEALLSQVDCRAEKMTAYDYGTPYSIYVVTVGGKPVAKNTAHAFLKLQAAAHAAGVTVSLTSGFRTNAEQQYLYGCYVNCSCNNCNLAAQPGYSNHQNGRAIDVWTSNWNWLFSHAASYGFQNTVPSEEWHWEYVKDVDPGGPCSGGAYQGSSSLSWVSPKDGGWYTNGIWFKTANADKKVAEVQYWAGNYKLGTSKNPVDFAVRYTFSQTGWRSITAKGFDGAHKQIAESTITINVQP